MGWLLYAKLSLAWKFTMELEVCSTSRTYTWEKKCPKQFLQLLLQRSMPWILNNHPMDLAKTILFIFHMTVSHWVLFPEQPVIPPLSFFLWVLRPLVVLFCHNFPMTSLPLSLILNQPGSCSLLTHSFDLLNPQATANGAFADLDSHDPTPFSASSPKAAYPLWNPQDLQVKGSDLV